MGRAPVRPPRSGAHLHAGDVDAVVLWDEATMAHRAQQRSAVEPVSISGAFGADAVDPPVSPNLAQLQARRFLSDVPL